MNKTLLSFALAVLAARSFAQVPNPPFFAVPPAGSAWEIKIIGESGGSRPPAESAGGASRMPDPTLLSLKHGRNGVIEGTIQYSDGSRQVYYAADGFLLQKTTNTGKPVLTSAVESERDPFSLKVTAFPGLGWLAQSHFKGRETRSDTECLRFAYTPMFGEPPEPGPALEAWIRASDLKPVEAAAGGRRYLYSEITSLEADISLPDLFSAALAQRKEERASIELIRQINARLKARQGN